MEQRFEENESEKLAKEVLAQDNPFCNQCFELLKIRLGGLKLNKRKI